MTLQDQSVSAPSTDFLTSAALTVAHSTALGTLDGCTFGADGCAPLDDFQPFGSYLTSFYDRPGAAAHLQFVRQAWQAAYADTQGEMDASDLPSSIRAATFERHGVLAFAPGTQLDPRQPDDVVMTGVLGHLIRLARDWQSEHPRLDGLETWQVDSVHCGAAFAHQYLRALAQATVGEPLTLAEEDTSRRWQVARHLAGQPAFLALSDREKQGLHELLLLMPTFLAAMYRYASLAGDEDSQWMTIELALDYLQGFFGEVVERDLPPTLNMQGIGLDERQA